MLNENQLQFLSNELCEKHNKRKIKTVYNNRKNKNRLGLHKFKKIYIGFDTVMRKHVFLRQSIEINICVGNIQTNFNDAITLEVLAHELAHHFIDDGKKRFYRSKVHTKEHQKLTDTLIKDLTVIYYENFRLDNRTEERTNEEWLDHLTVN